MKSRKLGDDKRQNWLLIVHDDKPVGRSVRRYKRSVSTGRSFAEIAKGRRRSIPNVPASCPVMSRRNWRR